MIVTFGYPDVVRMCDNDFGMSCVATLLIVPFGLALIAKPLLKRVLPSHTLKPELIKSYMSW